MNNRGDVRGLVSNYGLSLKLALLLAIAFAAVAWVVAARCRRAGRQALAPTSRVLAVGSAVVVAIATGLPQDWPFRREGYGDLVLELGRGGLAQGRRVFEQPDTLTSILFVANVVLYLPLAFFTTVGWRVRAAGVLAACLLLSVLVETTQYFVTSRIASLDDVLLNMGGAVVGLVFGLIVRRGTSARSGA